MKVVKRNGEKVDFDPNKIFEACKKAGASEDIAEEVSEEVQNRLQRISTKELRNLVLDVLEQKDKDAANNWKKYDIEHGKADDEQFFQGLYDVPK